MMNLRQQVNPMDPRENGVFGGRNVNMDNDIII